MDRANQEQGECLLKKWAESKKRIEEIQKEINLIKNNINPLIDEKFAESKIKVMYEKIISEYFNQIYRQMDEFKKLNSMIIQCTSLEKEVIIQRYLKGYSWDKIALENYVSKSTCFNIRKKIINKLIKKE